MKSGAKRPEQRIKGDRGQRWQDPALQAVLARLSARGLSAAQIADGIGKGVTRNAVASAMKRYGLFAKSRKRRPVAEGEPNGAANSHRR